MATPADPLADFLATQRLVGPDGKASPELLQFLAALIARVNDHETRVAALEP